MVVFGPLGSNSSRGWWRSIEECLGGGIELVDRRVLPTAQCYQVSTASSAMPSSIWAARRTRKPGAAGPTATGIRRGDVTDDDVAGDVMG